MNTYDPSSDYYGATPLTNWQGVIHYYSALSAKTNWSHLRPLFDLVKQLSLSASSAELCPDIRDDVLFLSRTPLGDTPDTQSRLSIHQESNGEMRIEIFSAGDPDPQTIACSREQAMPILSKILWKL